MPKEQLEYWARRDPIDAFARYLRAHKITDSEMELSDIDKKIEGLLERSVQEALDAPFPDPSIAEEDVYA